MGDGSDGGGRNNKRTQEKGDSGRTIATSASLLVFLPPKKKQKQTRNRPKVPKAVRARAHPFVDQPAFAIDRRFPPFPPRSGRVRLPLPTGTTRTAGVVRSFNLFFFLPF